MRQNLSGLPCDSCHTAGVHVTALVDPPVLNERRSRKMKQNEYNAAEVVELGPAQAIVLGEKIFVPDLDSTGGEPMEWRYQE